MKVQTWSYCLTFLRSADQNAKNKKKMDQDKGLPKDLKPWLVGRNITNRFSKWEASAHYTSVTPHEQEDDETEEEEEEEEIEEEEEEEKVPTPRPKDWWWDTMWGPDGNDRKRGPRDDDQHKVLVINRPGFTRERYLADDLEEFMIEVRQVLPTDIWVEVAEPLYKANNRKTLQLCKQDTLPEERDGLIAKGFTYLGSRGDLRYFIEPEEPIVEDQRLYSDVRTLYYPICGVRIRIVRGECLCDSYHTSDHILVDLTILSSASMVHLRDLRPDS